MDNMRTFNCGNCGATLATSAAPGTTLDCQYCGTANEVPVVDRPAGDQPGPTDRPPAMPPGAADATVVARGMPGSLPAGPEHDRPIEERLAPQPGTPADIGYTVDADAGRPLVERGEPAEPVFGPAGEPAGEPDYQAGSAIGELRPAPTPETRGEEPSMATVIAEPLKHGVDIPAARGEPVITGPGRVTVTPPQAPIQGGPAGAAMAARPNRVPLIVGGGLLAVCCLLALGLACVWAVLAPLLGFSG
jgi:hypothetical protein